MRRCCALGAERVWDYAEHSAFAFVLLPAVTAQAAHRDAFGLVALVGSIVQADLFDILDRTFLWI